MLQSIHDAEIAIIQAYLDGIYNARETSLRLELYHDWTDAWIVKALDQPRKTILNLRGY